MPSWDTGGTATRNTCQLFKTVLNTTTAITRSYRGCYALRLIDLCWISSDCKSLVSRLRWFESNYPHLPFGHLWKIAPRPYYFVLRSHTISQICRKIQMGEPLYLLLRLFLGLPKFLENGVMGHWWDSNSQHTGLFHFAWNPFSAISPKSNGYWNDIFGDWAYCPTSSFRSALRSPYVGKEIIDYCMIRSWKTHLTISKNSKRTGIRSAGNLVRIRRSGPGVAMTPSIPTLFSALRWYNAPKTKWPRSWIHRSTPCSAIFRMFWHMAGLMSMLLSGENNTKLLWVALFPCYLARKA